MRPEHRLALAIILCAALLSGAVMLRDASITGLAVENFSTGVNTPPNYTGNNTWTTAVDAPFVIDLAPLFIDAENDSLTFIITEEDKVAVSMDGSIAALTPETGFVGERVLTIITSDGTNIVRTLVKFVVGEAEAPVVEAPVIIENITLPVVDENITNVTNMTIVEPVLNETNVTNETKFAAPVEPIITVKTFALNEDVRDVSNAVVGKKTADESGYETSFVFIGTEGNEFVLRFYHNATATLPVWVEGAQASLSASTAGPNEQVNLSVPLVSGQASYFKLHVGFESEIFEFGTATPPSPPSEPTFTTAVVPTIAQVILNTTNPFTNDSRQNLTVFVINATDADGNSVQNITDFRLNGSSIAVMNMPFETNQTGNLTAGAVRDYGTFGNNGTLGAGAAGSAPTWVLARVGGGYLHDGTADFINVSTSQSLNLTEFTLVAWINPTTVTDVGIITRTFDDGIGINPVGLIPATPTIDAGYSLRINAPENNLFCLMGIGTATVTANTTNNRVPPGVWTQVACTYNGSNLTAYINGTFQNSTFAPGLSQTGTSDLWIGKSRNTAGTELFYNGQVDEAQVFNRSLSEEQLRQMYLDGVAGLRTERLLRQELRNDDRWQACAVPNDNSSDGTLVCSNNVTIQSQGCLTINSTTTLVQNASSLTTCVTFGASNIELRCDGYTIIYGANGSTMAYGVQASNVNNITVRDCFILDNNSVGAFNIGINFTNVSHSFIFNSTILTNGSNDAYGILLSNSSNNSVQNNTIITNGTTLAHGVFARFNAHNNTIFNNNIRARGTGITNNGIYLLTLSHDNRVLNNSVNCTGSSNCAGVRVETAHNAIVANNSVRGQSAAGNNWGIYLVTGASNAFVAHNNVSSNATTGHAIHLDGSGNNTVVHNDVNVSASAGSSNGIRVENAGSSFNIIANNTVHTARLGAGSQLGILVSTTVFNNTIENNTVRTNGTTGNEGILVQSTAHNNLVRHNTVVTGGTAGSNYGIHVQSTAHNNTVFNNTINTTGTSLNVGIRIESTAENNTIINNTIRASGSTNNNFGIYLITTVAGNNVTGNVVSTNGTSTNHGIRLESAANRNRVVNNTVKAGGSTTSSYGIHLVTNNAFNNITANVVTATGTSNASGIVLETQADNNTVADNIILSGNGTFQTVNNHGIRLLTIANSNNITNNRINTTGNLSHGISVENGVQNNRFVLNNISTSGANSFAVNVLRSNNTIWGNNTLTAPSEWILSGANTLNNFTNTTFVSFRGSIRITEFAVNGSQNVSQQRLNVSFNNSFLASTNLTFMNISSQVILDGITFVDPRPTVDFEDDGSYVNCPGSVCSEVSYAGGVFTFNVTQFTSFSSAESAVISCPTTLTESTSLGNSLAANLTTGQFCIGFGANSLFFNCSGFSLNSNGTGIGINITDRENITIRDCTILNFTTAIQVRDANHTLVANTSANNVGLAVNLTRTVRNTTITEGFFNGTGQIILSSPTADLLSNVNFTLTNTQINTSASGPFIQFRDGLIENVTMRPASGAVNILAENATIRHLVITGAGDMLNIRGVNYTFEDSFINSTSTNALTIRHSNNSVIRRVAAHAQAGGLGTRAIFVVRELNNTVLSRLVGLVNSSAAATFGIEIFTAGSPNIWDNVTIEHIRGVSANSSGIELSGGLQNQTIVNATGVGTSISGVGIDFGNVRNVTILNGTAISNTSDAGSGAVVFGTSARNNSLDNVRIHANFTWIEVGVRDNNISNTTFVHHVAELFIPGAVNLSHGDVNIDKLNLSNNRAFLNSTNLTSFNQSATIRLRNQTVTDPRALVDFQDDGTFINCPGSICTEDSYSNGVFAFNVTQFTAFSSAESAVAGCGVVVNESTSLVQNLSANGTCVIINASNLFFNCSGFRINGSGVSMLGIGINVSNQTNVTVRDCFVENFSVNILLDRTNNSVVVNNTAGNASAQSILVLNGSRNLVANNTARTESDIATALEISGGNNHTLAGNNASSTIISAAIIVRDAAANNTLRDNLGTSSVSSLGIAIQDTMDNLLINNTAISVTQTALRLSSNAYRNTLVNNTASSTNGSGMFVLSSSNNTFINNEIKSLASGTALTVSIAVNNTFVNNTVSSNTSLAISIGTSSTENNTFHNTTIYTNNSWLNTGPSGNSGNNFTGTKFQSQNGSIRITPTVALSAGVNASISRLNTTFNNSFLNASNLTFFNTSARIELRGIRLFNPDPVVDFQDDGTFADCPASICTEISFNASGDNTLVFDVTRFTSYATNASVIDSCPLGISENTTLTQNLTSNTSCITFNVDNIALNCAGYTIRYNGNGGDSANGVIASGRSGVSVRDCIILDINSSGSNGHAINFTNTSHSSIVNNSVTTNGSQLNIGVLLHLNSSNHTIENNTIRTFGNNQNNFGIRAQENSSLNRIRRNTILTTTTTGGGGIGIFISNADSRSSSATNVIENNTIRTAGVGVGNYGVNLMRNVSDTNVSGNVIVAEGTQTDQDGIRVELDSQNIRIIHNSITTNGSNDSIGIRLLTGTSSVFIDFNNITTNGTTSYGVFVNDRVSRTFINYTNITSRGHRAYAVAVLDSNGTFLNNTMLNAPEWINTSANTLSNFTNITFMSGHGSVQFGSLVHVNGSQDVNGLRFNISSNRVRLNSTNLTFLNISARIGINNVVTSNPTATVDFEDDGSFVTCPGSVCAEENVVNGVFRFNVTQFTSFSSQVLPPNITQVLLNTTNITGNDTRQNLTVLFINTTDPVQNITDWRIHGASIAMLNLPFERNQTANVSAGAVRDYGTQGYNATLGDGTASQAPVWVGGKVGGAYRFDGSNDYISVNDSNLWAFGTRDFTIDLWVNFSVVNAGAQGAIPNVFIAHDTGGGAQNKWIFSLGGGLLSLHINNPGEPTNAFFANSAFTPAANTSWYHLAVRRHDGKITIFVNGTEMGSSITSATIPNAAVDLTIGQSEGIGFINGLLDEIHIWNRSLSNEQIFDLYKAGNMSVHLRNFSHRETWPGEVWTVAATANDANNESPEIFSNNVTIINNASTIGQVSLNAQSSAANNTFQNFTVAIADVGDAQNDSTENITNWFVNGTSIIVLNMPFETEVFVNNSLAIRDYSPLQNNGTLGRGLVTSIPVWNSSGRVGAAYQFNGSDDTMIVPNSVSINFTASASMSVSAWAYRTGGGTTQHILGKRTGCSGDVTQYQLAFDATNGMSFMCSVSGAQMATNSWQHLAGAFNGTHSFMYVNGTLVDSDACTMTPTQANLKIGIAGNDDTLCPGFTGLVDEVMIFNRSLTPDQMRQLFLDNNASRHMTTLVHNETEPGQVWRVDVIPNDHITDGAVVSSNNVTIEAEAEQLTGCAVINTSTTLTQNLTSNGTCITIANSSLVFNCAGFTIFYDAQGTGGDGVVASGRTNVTVRDCIIRDINVSGAFGLGVNFTTTNNSLIVNNSVFTNGTNDNYGVLLHLIAVSNIVENNTIQTQGTETNNIGVHLLNSANSNNVTSNNVTTNGSSTNHGILVNNPSVITASNLFLRNNILARGTAGSNVGVYFNAAQGNNVSHNRITTDGTSNNAGIRAESSSGLNAINNNTIQTSGTGASNYGVFLTTSITYTNITFNTIRTAGTNENAGVVIFSTSTDNIVSNNTILTNGTGTTNYGAYLISSVSRNNITNNSISTNGTTNNYGVYLVTSATGNNIILNSVTTNGTSVNAGVRLESSSNNNVVERNVISTGGSSTDNYGIETITTTTNINITNNTISTSGASVNHGIFLHVGSNSNNVWRNVIRTHGTGAGSQDIGIYLNGAESNNVTDNILYTNGTSGNEGIRLESAPTNNRFGNNTIQTDGPSGANYGVRVLQSGSNNSFNNNNLTTIGGVDSYGIIIATSNETLFNNTILTKPIEWISTGANTLNNFSNTTFVSTNGSIRIIPLVQINGTQDVTQQRLNVTFNRAFLNSTNLTFLNQSAQITLTGITSIDPQPIVDFNDDNVFANCSSVICQKVSYANNEFVFNVTGFTTFSTAEGNVNITLTKTDHVDPVNSSGFLNYTITINVTAGNASNITLTDVYPPQVIFLSSQPPNSTGNNTFIIGNLTSGNIFQVNISVLVNNVSVQTVINNTANITYQNVSGSTFFFNVTENTTVNAQVTVPFNVTNITITKIDAPDPVDAGAQLNYTLFVNVTGNGTAYNVTVNDTYPSQVVFNSAQPPALTGTNNTFILGNLTQGTNFSINITLNVSSTLINNTIIINNTANVTFQNETSQAFQSRTTNTSTTVLALAFNITNMTVTKTDSPDPVIMSTFLNYTIFVNVTGNGTAYNVTVNDTYPNQTIFLSSQPASLTGTNNTWILGNLTVGTNFSINISLITTNISNNITINNSINASFQNETSQGYVTRNVTISTAVYVPVQTNVTNISITKTDAPDPVNSGEQLNYSIFVNVTGNGTAYNVTVNDTYPSQVIFNSAQPAPLTGTNNTWILGNLTAGTNFSINITLNVSSTLINNTMLINNTANVTFQNETSQAFQSRIANTSTTMLANAFNFTNITITKIDAPDPVENGTQLNYTIFVNVTGNGTAFNVTVNDTFPAGVIVVNSSPQNLTGTNNTWVLGNLTNGTSFSINITVNVTQVANGTLINNTANVTFQNETSQAFQSRTANTSTLVENVTIAPAPAPAPTAGGGSVSGGGGGVVPPVPEVEAPACVENWECGGWSQCSGGRMVRECVEINNCGTAEFLPSTEWPCVSEPVEEEQRVTVSPLQPFIDLFRASLWPLVGGVLVIILILVGVWTASRVPMPVRLPRMPPPSRSRFYGRLKGVDSRLSRLDRGQLPARVRERLKREESLAKHAVPGPVLVQKPALVRPSVFKRLFSAAKLPDLPEVKVPERRPHELRGQKRFVGRLDRLDRELERVERGRRAKPVGAPQRVELAPIKVEKEPVQKAGIIKRLFGRTIRPDRFEIGKFERRPAQIPLPAVKKEPKIELPKPVVVRPIPRPIRVKPVVLKPISVPRHEPHAPRRDRRFERRLEIIDKKMSELEKGRRKAKPAAEPKRVELAPISIPHPARPKKPGILKRLFSRTRPEVFEAGKHARWQEPKLAPAPREVEPRPVVQKKSEPKIVQKPAPAPKPIIVNPVVLKPITVPERKPHSQLKGRRIFTQRLDRIDAELERAARKKGAARQKKDDALRGAGRIERELEKMARSRIKIPKPAERPEPKAVPEPARPAKPGLLRRLFSERHSSHKARLPEPNIILPEVQREEKKPPQPKQIRVLTAEEVRANAEKGARNKPRKGKGFYKRMSNIDSELDRLDRKLKKKR